MVVREFGRKRVPSFVAFIATCLGANDSSVWHVSMPDSGDFELVAQTHNVQAHSAMWSRVLQCAIIEYDM